MKMQKGLESRIKKERKKELLLISDKYKKERKSWTRSDDSTKYVNGSPITIQKMDKNTKQNLWMKKVRKITVYNKKLKVDTLTKHISDIVNWQLDVENHTCRYKQAILDYCLSKYIQFNIHD